MAPWENHLPVARFLVLVLLSTALTMEPGYSQDKKAPPEQALSAELVPAKKSLPRGTVPTFKLQITNASKGPEKVLKLRGDLQDTYV